jgi:serine/threonine protein kinase
MIERIGKFEVIRLLGRGATAVVYLARDPESGHEVAIKLIRFGQEKTAISRRLLKLFQTEDAIGRCLNHPNIVRIYDAIIEPEQAYIVMEFIDGTPLDKYCAVNSLLPMHRVIGIIFKCCLALDYAFRQGVVHRDIKPANILIDVNDNPKITDFGLAINLNKNVNKDSTFVMGVGSPAYMSPEQIKNYPLNQKTDLYSLGVLLFQLLTGRLPFRANNPATLVYKIINMDAPSVCELSPNLPAGIDFIVRKALEKDLYSRYRNGAEFAKDLSTVRYQILDEDESEKHTSHFKKLRKLGFFTDFEDIELWEILRVSTWREISARMVLIQEGETGNTFGVIVSGLVEVSISGKAICSLGAGEVVGEMAFLCPSDKTRRATVITLEKTLFLDINTPALELSSEEVRERFNKLLIGKVIARLRHANHLMTKLGEFAVHGTLNAVFDKDISPPLELL